MICNGQSDQEHKSDRCSYDHQQEDFCSLRPCALASLRSHSQFNAKSQSCRDAKSIVNPCRNVFRVVVHPTDHYTIVNDIGNCRFLHPCCWNGYYPAQ